MLDGVRKKHNKKKNYIELKQNADAGIYSLSSVLTLLFFTP